MKKEIIHNGPSLNDKVNVKKFSQKHKNCFNKNKKIYAKESLKFNINNFLNDWFKQNKQKIKEMYIENFNLVLNF